MRLYGKIYTSTHRIIVWPCEVTGSGYLHLIDCIAEGTVCMCHEDISLP